MTEERKFALPVRVLVALPVAIPVYSAVRRQLGALACFPIGALVA